VTAAVKFNRQLCFHAMEIEKVNTARILPAKFEIFKATVAKQTPETFLGVRGFFAKVAGEIAGFGSPCATRTPHPDPLPCKGRGNRNFAVVAAHCSLRFFVIAPSE
jgi:hypothetical protein